MRMRLAFIVRRFASVTVAAGSMAVRGVEVGVENRQALFHRVGGDLRGCGRQAGCGFQVLANFPRIREFLALELRGEGFHFGFVGRFGDVGFKTPRI